MYFVLSSNILSTHINTIGRVIVQKNNLRILDCFLFDIKDNVLTITASDNDTTFVTHLALNECDGDMCFAVNAKILQDAIKEISDQPIRFEFDANSFELIVRYQNGQYKLMAQDASEYPTLKETEGTQISLTMHAPTLFTSISRALVSAAKENLRPQLNAICFDVRKESLNIVACDGNQLSRTKIQQSSDMQGVFLLSMRPATLLKNMLTKEQENVNLNLSERSAVIETENFKMVCRLLEGKYPNYESIIPTKNHNVLTINRMALVSALRRIMIFANPNAVLVTFRLSNSTLNISSQDVDFGKSAEENMLCDYTGIPMNIAFKGSIMLDLLQNLDSEEVVIKLASPTSPGLIEPAEQKENEEVLLLTAPALVF